MKKYILFLLVLCVQITFSQSRIQTLTLVRPANATAYTANDVVGDTGLTALLFTNAGKKGVIQSVVLSADTVNTANATFRLYLYHSSTTSTYTDNIPDTMYSADASKLIGYINFTLVTSAGGSTMATCLTNSTDLWYTTTTGTLYGRLVATGAYVPKVSGVLTLRMTFKE